jgi:hypothetical protein
MALAASAPALAVSTWGLGSAAPADVRARENDLERRVTEVLATMSVVCLTIDDPPGPESERGYVERNAVGLLSNLERPVVDPPSPGWLGLNSPSAQIRGSGLWNVDHVRGANDDGFIERFEILVERDCSARRK